VQDRAVAARRSLLKSSDLQGVKSVSLYIVKETLKVKSLSTRTYGQDTGVGFTDYALT